MQPINSHNYEAYFLDFLEGNLTAEQKEQLHLFLDKYPDLKAEFEETKPFYLDEPSTTAFKAKEKLYRNEETALLQEEYLCIAAAEGILTAEEQIEFDELLLKQNDLLTELAYFQKARLSAPSIVFPEKEKLKRKALPLITWKTYISTAAAAVLVIFLLNSPQAEQSYRPQILSMQLPTENLDETDLLSAELNVSEKISEPLPQKQVKEGKPHKKNQSVVGNQFAYKKVEKLNAIDPKPFYETATNVALVQTVQKAEQQPLKAKVATQPEKEELPTALEFAKSKVKKEMMKNKSLGDFILAEASRFGEEKLNVQVKKAEKEDVKFFAINIGNFSYSRSR